MSEDRRENRDGEISRPLAELISAYLDDRESLSSRELEQIELLLEQDEDAQRLHAEMRIITDGLRNLDPVPAPHSYHLDAEMVGAPEPVVLQETSVWSTARWARHTEKVRWATAAAAVLFVFVLGADLVLNGVFSDSAGDDGSFESNQAEMTSRQGQDDDDSEEAGILADEGAGDDSGAVEADGDEAGSVDDSAPTPESEPAGESDAGDLDSDTSGEAVPEDESEDSEDMVEEAEESEEAVEESGDGTDAVEATEGGELPTAEVAPDAIEKPQEDAAPGEASANDETLAFGQDVAESDDEGSDRRLWRIAEFGLVMLLGLLITALVVLPRIGGNGAAHARDGR